MSVVRMKVREVEEDPSRMEDVLKSSGEQEEFIDLYLKRNPRRRHPLFLRFYRSVSIESQVILYEETREYVEDSRFEYGCIMRYCVEERSGVFQDVIRNARDKRMVFRILGDRFLESTCLDADTDLFATKCLVEALCTHEIEREEMDVVVSGVGRHLGDSRRRYYEHGAIVASVLLDTNEFGIESMEEAQRMIEHIPPRLLEQRHREEFVNPNDVFVKYKKVENDVSGLVARWRPRSLQEGIKAIQEEKDRRMVEGAFRHFPEIVRNSTERVLRSRWRDAFDAVMGYDGYEEYKVDAVYSLLSRSFDFMAMDVLDDFFSNRLCLRSKVLLVFVLRRIVEDGAYEHARAVCESVWFVYKRKWGEMVGPVQNCVEGLLERGSSRMVGAGGGEFKQIFGRPRNVRGQGEGEG